MNLSENDYGLIYKKLEYTFKHSNNPIVQKIIQKEILSINELEVLMKKFEYRFKKSNPEIIFRIREYLKGVN